MRLTSGTGSGGMSERERRLQELATRQLAKARMGGDGDRKPGKNETELKALVEQQLRKVKAMAADSKVKDMAKDGKVKDDVGDSGAENDAKNCDVKDCDVETEEESSSSGDEAESEGPDRSSALNQADSVAAPKSGERNQSKACSSAAIDAMGGKETKPEGENVESNCGSGGGEAVKRESAPDAKDAESGNVGKVNESTDKDLLAADEKPVVDDQELDKKQIETGDTNEIKAKDESGAIKNEIKEEKEEEDTDGEDDEEMEEDSDTDAESDDDEMEDTEKDSEKNDEEAAKEGESESEEDSEEESEEKSEEEDKEQDKSSSEATALTSLLENSADAVKKEPNELAKTDASATPEDLAKQESDAVDCVPGKSEKSDEVDVGAAKDGQDNGESCKII